MFSMASIMKAAWTMYRSNYGNRPSFLRDRFNWLLMVGWKRAKESALRASNPVLARIEEIKEEIEMLSYKPWRIDIDLRRSEFKKQMESLLAA
jgi:hypothetical protein